MNSINQTQGPRVSVRRSRRQGKLLRRLLLENVFSFQMSEINPTYGNLHDIFDQYLIKDDKDVTLQCNPICGLSELEPSIEVPHNEVAFFEMVQKSPHQLVAVHQMYNSVVTNLPRKMGGFLIRRMFGQKFSRDVYSSNENVVNLCNTPLLIALHEQEFFTSRVAISSSVMTRSAAVDALYTSFCASARIIYLAKVAHSTKFNETLAEEFQERALSLLGAASCSFVVDAVPMALQSAVVEIYLRGTVNANLLRYIIENNDYEFPVAILEAIDHVLESWAEKYTEFFSDPVDFQARKTETIGIPDPTQTVLEDDEEEEMVDAFEAPPGLFRSIGNVFTRFSRFGSNVEMTAENMQKITTELSDTIETVGGTAKEATTMFSSMFEKFRGITFQDVMVALTTKILPIALGIVVAYRLRGWIAKIFVVIAQVLIGFYGTQAAITLVNKFVAWASAPTVPVVPMAPLQQVRNLEFPEDDVHLQGGFSESAKDFVDLMRPVLNIKRFEMNDPLDSLFDVFTDDDPLATQANKLLFVFTKTSEWWEKLSKKMGWWKSDLSQYCSGYDDVDEFAKRCSIMLGQEIMPTQSNKSEVTALYNLSVALREKYAKKRAVSDLLRDFIPRIHKIKIEIDKMDTSGINYRVEPVSLFLTSEPGLGKTTALEIINNRLTKYSIRNSEEALALFEQSPKEFLFTRINSKFWEGCHNYVKTIYYPDYLAGNSDVTGAAHETELIDVISCQQYSPDMAFEKKGYMDLRPDWVTAGTNESSVRGDSANHPKAVARRLYLFKLIWKGPGKGPEKGMPLNTDFWRFQIWVVDESNNFVVDPKYDLLTLDEVVNLTIIRREMQVRKMAVLRKVIQKDSDFTRTKVLKTMNVTKFEVGEDEFSILKRLQSIGTQAKPDVVLEPLFVPGTMTPNIDITSDSEIERLCFNMNFEQFSALMDDSMVLQEILQNRYMLLGLRLGLPANLTMRNWDSRIENKDYRGLYNVLHDPKCSIDNFSDDSVTRFEAPHKRYIETMTGLLTSLTKDTIMDIATAVVSFCVTYAAIQWFMGAPEEEKTNVVLDNSEVQGKTYVDMKALRAKQRSAKAKKIRVKLESAHTQGTPNVKMQSSESLSVALEKAKYHVFEVYASGVQFQNIVALGERDFFINHHALGILLKSAKDQGIEDGFIVAKNRHRDVAPFKISLAELRAGIKDEAGDVIFFRASEAPESRSILPHWAEDKFVLDKINSRSVHCGVAALLNSYSGPQFNSTAKIINGRHIQEEDGSMRFYRQLWRTEMNSEVGDCGSLYWTTSNDMGQSGKFIGFHAMGNNGFGPVYACAVTKTTIEDALAILRGVPKTKDPGQRDIIGEAPLRHRFETRVTDVRVPSEYVATEARQAPAPVNDPEAYYKISAKYNKTKPLSKDLQEKLRTCIRETLKHWELVQEHAMHTGFITLEQAIKGEAGTTLKGVDLSTSAGFPHNCLGNTKHKLMGRYVDGEFEFGDMTDVTVEEVDEWLEMLAKGVVPMHVYTDVTKAELLPKEKVEQGKVRLVSAAPNAGVLTTKMLFGNFIRWIMDNPLSNGVEMTNQEGMDAHYITQMHLTMAAGQDLHTAGDLSAYDTRHSRDALRIVLECIVEFILQRNPGAPDEVRRMLLTYTESLSCTYHIRGSTVHRWIGSLPSGHPLTTIINSVLNKGYFSYSVWKSTGFKLGFWPWYFTNFIVRVLGDDNRASCSPEAKQHLSETICANGYADFGHVYTNDEKNGINDDFRPFEKTTLLKRFARFEPLVGLYVAPLRIDVIEELPLWTRGEGKDLVPSISQAIANVETAVRYLSYHDDEQWNRLIPLWERMYAEYGWVCPFPNRASAFSSSFGAQLVEV